MKKETNYIFGRHAVTLAIDNKANTIQELFLAKGISLTKQQQAAIKKYDVVVRGINPATLPKDIALDEVHQGMVAIVNPERLINTLDHFLTHTPINADTCVVLLGEVQDPQNVGAIIRSAAAFGASAVLIPEHNQAPVNGTVVKVSAGMAFTIPLVSIGNVNQALRDLKDKGFWVYGLSGESTNSLTAEKFDAPTVIVVGNESEGVRVKTKELCDVMLSIPMHSQCESLNVAASTAVALYQWSTQHPHVVRR